MSIDVTVHVASHYNPERKYQLSVVLEAVLLWRECTVNITIDSNTDYYETDGFLKHYIDRFSESRHVLTLNVVRNLEDPFMLTWAHKRELAAWLEGDPAEDDLFIYIEDDIVLTDQNIMYFRDHLSRLRPTGLIPGFLRYESSEDRRLLVDISNHEFWRWERTLSVDGILYHANVIPYWAGFIMNRALSAEYMKSRSFDPSTSADVVDWGIRERAAMGLTYERAPRRLGSRVVIPIVDGLPDPGCLVWHCSNNYSARSDGRYCRQTVHEAYGDQGRRQYISYKLGRLGSHLRRLAHRNI